MTRHCLVREGVFSVKQLQNVVQVSSSELDESLLNDCDESAGDYVADGQRMSVQDLVEESVAREEDAGRGNSNYWNQHHMESHVSEEDSAEEIQEAEPPSRRS